MSNDYVSRVEQIIGYGLGDLPQPPEPISRMDKYLTLLIEKIKEGGATPEQITSAVERYLSEHPIEGGSVTPEQLAEAVKELESVINNGGATEKQLAQIEQNKNDIADLDYRLSESITELKEDLNTPIYILKNYYTNLYDKDSNDNVIGQLVNSNGFVDYSVTSKQVTHYITCFSSEELSIICSSSISKACLYDSEKKFLSILNMWHNANSKFTVNPSCDGYIRFEIFTGGDYSLNVSHPLLYDGEYHDYGVPSKYRAILNGVLVDRESYATKEYVKNEGFAKKQNLEEIGLTSKHFGYVNMMNMETCTDGKEINVDGYLLDFEGRSVSNFINVDGLDSVVIVSQSCISKVCGYSNDGVFISNQTVNKDNNKATVTLDSDVKKIRVSFIGNKSTSKVMVRKSTDEYNKYVPYGVLTLKNTNVPTKLSELENDVGFGTDGSNEQTEKILKNKTWYFLGDSHTAQGRYINSIVGKTGVTAINYGIGGTRLADTDGNQSNAMCYRWDQMSDAEPDIITVLGGSNDCYYSKIGTKTDKSVSTVGGAVYTIIKGLQEKYPNALLVFVNMPPRFDSRWEDYANIVLDTCNYNRVPCVDIYHECGCNEWNYTYFYLENDMIHLNEKGAEVVANLITSKVLECYFGTDSNKIIEKTEAYDDAEIKREISEIKQVMPSDSPVVGKVLKVKKVNDDGTFICEWGDAPSDGYDLDVQITGTSIVKNGVANIPVAYYDKLGLISVKQNYGFIMNGYYLQILQASNNNIKLRDSVYHPITPNNLDIAVKSAMTDGKGAAWTDTEKTGAWSRLTSIKTSMDEVAVAGAHYYLPEQAELNITLPDDALTGQEITVVWYNGETPATLAINGNMLDFDYAPSANTRSEISALWDGKYWSLISNEQSVPVVEEVTTDEA